jgi:hypothetical protein
VGLRVTRLRQRVDSESASVPGVIGPESVSELVVDAHRDSADKPTKCRKRLIKVLQGHLEETHVYLGNSLSPVDRLRVPA